MAITHCSKQRVRLKGVRVCVRAVQTRVKANGYAPRLFIPARRINGHVAQIGASTLHDFIVMCIQRVHRFPCRLNREGLFSEAVGSEETAD